MDEEPQVFSSNITRSAKPLKSDLADLLKKIPAQQVLQKKYEIRNSCDFKPKIKFYEPKRKSKLKVRTVREIRHLFEKDVYPTLLVDLEKQQNYLLRKIKAGSRDENTKTLTKNMLKSDKPVSRSAWQMLMNLNPEGFAHSTQFVLWYGKRIRVNGSKGGTCKFMCKYDLSTKHFSKKTKSAVTHKPNFKKKGLLQNSLSINFKPGPLGKKNNLDDSYQKYHVGGIEVQDLPKPALEIQPTIGKTIDPTIAHFLHNMRQSDGTISEKWAEFSVSVLATVKNETVTQIEDECCVSFDLHYKGDRQRILMRRDVSSDFSSIPLNKVVADPLCDKPQDSVVTSEVQSILDKIIGAVEISLEQDNMYTGEDEPRDVNTEEPITNCTNTQPKEMRVKRKNWNSKELERLDVTIIRLSESVDKKPNNTCSKSYCNLGCVCTSLACAYNLKGHCGRIECMFECKCDFSKYKVVDSSESDCSELLPGLLKLDSEMSSKMAKEEQKFHHTVIVTSENSMLLKSKRRDWKSSRKYADFYSSMCLKNDSKPEKVATLVIEKLNIRNVEPWCMVHSLYKCFCKGRFTDNSIPDVKPEIANVDTEQQHTEIEDLTKDVETTNVKCNLKSRMSNTSQRNSSDNNYAKERYDIDELYRYNDNSCRSARVKPYTGRKFSHGYYFNANRKISEMELHDDKLRKRMIKLINISTSKVIEQVKKSSQSDSANNIVPVIPAPPPLTPAPPPLTPAPPTPPKLAPPPTAPPLSSPPALQPTGMSGTVGNTRIHLFTNRLPKKENLVAWLEMSYKQYKQRIMSGIKIALEPPTLGKMALHPWEFVLSRYRERKNLFLITTTTPYRIFMAVDPKHPLFRNCININEIRFADLLKYPVTVKNLLTNAKDLKDNFCILCGLSHCWELIGSVTKVGEHQGVRRNLQPSDEEQNDDFSDISSDAYHLDSEDSNATSVHADSFGQNVEEEKATSDDNKDSSSDSSRWFVMTVENDFDEIQFYNKGFFVKLESIIKAINVSRASKKTVRLSSQKCLDNTGQQFGVYAIPNENESCVFVGPYEKGEPLGIETVKKMSDIGKQRRTRGVWITTKKLENFNVIDNPLSFMPPKNVPDAEMMTLTGDSTNTNENKDSFENVSKGRDIVQGQNPEEKDFKSQKNPKILKPIKIAKTNNFYQLGPNGTLKQISQQRLTEQKQMTIFAETTPKVLNTTLLKLAETSYVPLLSNTSSILTRIPQNNVSRVDKKVITINKKPVAEIAPHVKMTTKCPETSVAPKTKDEQTKKERGMFILKPEEINKKLMQTQMHNIHNFTGHEAEATPSTSMDPELEMDIESFLATAEECEAPNDDILIISDDETDFHKEKNIWIECKTVESLGWIRGKKNSQGFLSFEFPGFKYTEFYMEEDAFAKLNKVLSRKIYMPKSLHLEWRVVESEQDLGTKQMLNQKELGPNFVMTKRGIRHKQQMLNNKSLKKDAGDVVHDSNTKTGESTNGSPHIVEQPANIVKLEEESQLLEEEGEVLWNTLKSSNNSLIGQGLKELDDLREQIAARLHSMVSDS